MVNAQLIVYILISITVPCVSGVVMWVPTNYPNPLLTPAACGMPGRSWICDPSGILNVTQAEELNSLIIDITRTTKCVCSQAVCNADASGYLISVALVKEQLGTVLGVTSQVADDIVDPTLRNLALFAYGLLNVWHFGRCSEDAVVVYYLPGNMVYTATNTASGVLLTNDIISQIVQQYMIYMGPKKNNFGGLHGILSSYRLVFTDQFNSTYFALHPPPVPAADTSMASWGPEYKIQNLICLTMLISLFV